MSRTYWASDYAGFESNNLSVYYGYEETEGDEWCFVAKVDGKEIARIPQSKLKGDPPDDCQAMLLAGIAQLFNTHELT